MVVWWSSTYLYYWNFEDDDGDQHYSHVNLFTHCKLQAAEQKQLAVCCLPTLHREQLYLHWVHLQLVDRHLLQLTPPQSGGVLHDMCITMGHGRDNIICIMVESVMTLALSSSYFWYIKNDSICQSALLWLPRLLHHRPRGIPCRTRSIIPRAISYIIFEEVISQLQNRSIARCAAPPQTHK